MKNTNVSPTQGGNPPYTDKRARSNLSSVKTGAQAPQLFLLPCTAFHQYWRRISAGG